MARKITTKIYIFSFIVTILIFSLGLTIGLVIEKERLQVIDKLNIEQEVDLKSLQLQQTYIESEAANCEALNKILEANIEEVSDSMSKVLDYSKKSMVDEEIFNLQLRDYFLTQIQFLLLSYEIKDVCDSDAITIIYFYDENKLDIQGDVLSYLKNSFGSKLLVFSFDSNFKEEPMIDVMMKSYNVTEFPTVIANDITYSGGVNAEELKEQICYELGYLHEECN